jgi:aminoglycoside 6-adenylyltransferase
MQGAADFSDILSRGVRVILDKGGVANLLTLVNTETPSPRPPTQSEFLEVINEFWYNTVWTVKKLRRGELWTAKFCLDSYIKWRCILRMMEWHARTVHGWNYDIWHDGRFLERWADLRTVEGLHDAFAHYNKDDIKRALLATMDLFRWLAVETAEQLSYPYPTLADERATELVRILLAENT